MKSAICTGSSPLTRGTQWAAEWEAAHGGIIPAYAGNTRSGRARARPSRDHPRLRGEHCAWVCADPSGWGSSPLTRGTPRRINQRARDAGIIPAYAGNTRYYERSAFRCGDHPRLRGEHSLESATMPYTPGSSPLTRGTPPRLPLLRLSIGIIPAYAGNTSDERRIARGIRDHPRLRGEHASSVTEA